MNWRRAVGTAALATAIAAGSAGLSGARASEHHAECRSNATDANAAALTDEQLRARLAEQGYPEVRSLAREHGCVEAKGIDKAGKRFEVYLHPVTGAIVGRESPR